MLRRRTRHPNELIESWLGENFRLDGGELSFPGCLRVDGVVDKAILRGPTLVVCEGARVSGRIEVDRLVIRGVVEADAIVTQSVVVAKDAVFRGTLHLMSPELQLEEGGVFQAKVRMGSAPAESDQAATPLTMPQPQAV